MARTPHSSTRSLAAFSRRRLGPRVDSPEIDTTQVCRPLSAARVCRSVVTVEHVLSDNGSCYRTFARRDAGAALGSSHKRARPYRPQTNGKSERFHRTLADGWAYARFYGSATERGAALQGWLHLREPPRRADAITPSPGNNRRRVAPTGRLGESPI